MQAFLDGRELKPDRPTLAAGLSVGVRTAESAGRIIVEAWLDGRPLTGDELEQPSDLPGAAFKLELTSAEPRELVATTLLDAVAALTDLDQTQRDAAKAIQQGKTQDAIEPIRQTVETWTSVRSIIERGSAILSIDLSNIAPAPLAPLIQDLSRDLAALKDALERQDWSRLADCLAYELTERSAQWREALQKLAIRLATGTDGGSPA